MPHVNVEGLQPNACRWAENHPVRGGAGRHVTSQRRACAKRDALAGAWYNVARPSPNLQVMAECEQTSACARQAHAT